MARQLLLGSMLAACGALNQRGEMDRFLRTAGDTDTITISDNQSLGLPRLILLGAQKGGTTYLRSALHEHPQLGTCCHPHNRQETIECGFLQWISKNLPDGEFRKRYADNMMRSSCGGPVLYDDRPDYLGALSGPDIRLTLSILPKKAIFVVTMRDPVPRMLSAMTMDSCMHGRESDNCRLPSHMETLDTLSPKSQHVSYGMYSKHLKRWLEHVPRERMMLFFFEDVITDPLTVMNQIVTKMGLDSFREMPEKVRSKPVQQERCNVGACGAPIKAKLHAAFAERARCRKLEAFYVPQNVELSQMTSSVVPLQWSKC